ncbi:putative queuine tRNA-ribosyltransferase [Podospora australis]|uniref:Queuine tRNA-ribosyltransferase accessory subunit 2 n=1 Tax=Podospora australis TaxID=1536484 RepID=A0AAN6X3Z0_9PEZI|nr:putative queuine tRNA-ribosyltransferase [Podospora australis]
MTVDIQDPEQEIMRFEVLKAAVNDGATAAAAAAAAAAARLGRLAFPGRAPINTPNFLGVTSRGTLPHVTPDNVSQHLNIGGVYMSLEDFIEKPQQNIKRIPPIYAQPVSPKLPTPLYSFTGMPSSVPIILSARRLPAVPSPLGNTNKSVSIFTNTGFQTLTTDDYRAAVSTLKPDIAIPLADLTSNTSGPPTSKRALRMAERTDEWIVDWFSSSSPPPSTATFAPVLPIPYPIQWEYLARLAEDYVPTNQLSGLAFHDNPDLLPDIAEHCPSLLPLPRLSLIPSISTTPHQVLRQVALGIDLFTLPFINTVSDAGIALNFAFPAPSPPPSGLQPLGTDLSLPSFATSLTPLATSLRNCQCYACKSHHAAYVHHLLAAREMLGWTLLQIHNHAVMTSFFAGIRFVLETGGEELFEKERNRFLATYEPDFPAGMGERPRQRGYQYKSVGGGEPKKNKPAWGKLGPDTPPAGEGQTGEEGPETPVVPEGQTDTVEELEKKGFAEEVAS